MANVVTLMITAPGDAPRAFEVPAGAISIGRDETCTVVLASPEVSRRHVTLEVTPGFVLVHDSSANGTRVGDRHVHRTSARVPHGTAMHVGPYLVSVASFERDAATPPALPVAPPDAPPPTVADPTVPPGALVAAPRAVAPLNHPASAPPPANTLRGNAIALAAPPVVAITNAPRAEAPVAPAAVTSGASAATRKKVHRMLLDHLDLAALDRARMNDDALRPRVREALKRIVARLADEVPAGPRADALVDEMTDEALGLGPLEALLGDPAVTEIMVVDPQTIYVEKAGRIERTEARFTDDEAVRAVIERIVTPLGRRIDESTPLVDARLRDGSRVNAVIRPLALRGAAITIRRFSRTPLRLDDLVRLGSVSDRMARFLTRAVIARRNLVISGGTGSGKTTLLNVLSGAIPASERIVTIEDAAELQLAQPHVVGLEARPPNLEGRGEYTIRDLVRNALRMRPDRIVVGECRGGEALDMLQAMNTGHEGSLTTTHANSPREAVARLETLALMSGLELPARAIREQIAASVHLVVQQSRFGDGSRRVTSIAEVVGLDPGSGEVELREIFAFRRTGTGADGKVLGEFVATGYLPTFLDVFIAQGLVRGGDYL